MAVTDTSDWLPEDNRPSRPEDWVPEDEPDVNRTICSICWRPKATADDITIDIAMECEPRSSELCWNDVWPDGDPSCQEEVNIGPPAHYPL